METAVFCGTWVIKVLQVRVKTTVHTYVGAFTAPLNEPFILENKQRSLKKWKKENWWQARYEVWRKRNEGDRGRGSSWGSVYLFKRGLSSGTKTKWGIRGEASATPTRCPALLLPPSPSPPPPSLSAYMSSSHPGVPAWNYEPLCSEDTYKTLGLNQHSGVSFLKGRLYTQCKVGKWQWCFPNFSISGTASKEPQALILVRWYPKEAY